jgi:predicted molibdopterin-dependent oxidoreductase YjgC
VVSRRGRVRGIELRITETVAPGQIFVPFHYAEANANEVTQSAFDPFSREPNYKQSAARVERAAALTPDSQRPTSKKAGARLGVGSWDLGVGARTAREGGVR